MYDTHVIAEAGTNHGGDLERAKELADIAHRAGADSVKFQIIYPEGLYLSDFYEDGEYRENEVFQQRAAAMLSDEDYRRLADHCRETGIPFSASVFDARGLDLLDELDAPYIKIASCDLNNSRLLTDAAERGRPLIVSTGMATLGEIERAVADVEGAGVTDLVLMHCVSIYPAPTERMNLSFLDVLASAFGHPVGLSDHTERSLAAAIAVSMGVAWIEKHFTYDRSADGFDHAYAMEPDSLATYINDVRISEQACDLPERKVGEVEASVKTRARRGLYAARDIEPGEVLRAEDVLIVRPESRLRPNDIGSLLGRTASSVIRRHEAFSWEIVG